MSENIKIVLFDIDGTILNCHSAGRLSLIKATGEIYGTAGFMENINFQGKTDPQILHESLLKTGISELEINKNMGRLKENYFKHLGDIIFEHKATLLPGIKNIISRLTRNPSVLLGLLTGNFKESARIKLGRFNLNNYFSFGVYGSDTADRNQMPAIAKKKVKEQQQLDINYSDMIIIGDTIHDINCAKNVGAVSISVGTGWTEKNILLRNEPDYFFDDMSDTDRLTKIILN